MLVAQQAALQEGASGARRRQRRWGGGDLGAMEGGLADDLGPDGVALVGLQENTQAGHGGDVLDRKSVV